MCERRLLWREPQTSLQKWRHLRCSELPFRAVTCGIYGPLLVPFRKEQGIELADVPQTMEKKAFAVVDLREGCAHGIYREVLHANALKAKAKRSVIFSDFKIWQDISEVEKGMFLVKLSNSQNIGRKEQSKHWKKGTVRMDSIPKFAIKIEQGDQFISFDLKNRYRHFRLYPNFRD